MNRIILIVVLLTASAVVGFAANDSTEIVQPIVNVENKIPSNDSGSIGLW